MTTYRTNDKDRIDLICWKHYGSLSGRIVEQVLEANPGLSVAEELPSGCLVALPELITEKIENSLW